MEGARPGVTDCYSRVVRRASLLLLLVLAGCGPDREDWPDGRPKIDNLRFVQQRPLDPYALEFLIEFSDTDGDVGEGQLHLSVEGSETSVLALQEVFESQAPPVALDVSSGEFEVVVRMSTNVEVGDQIKVGFLIEDKSGEKSNEPWIRLQALAE